MALDKVNIGERIRKIREELYKETRQEFAERCGFSENQLGKVERGDVTVTTRMLDKICSITGVSSNYILYGEESTKTFKIRDSIENLLDKCSNDELAIFFKFLSMIKAKFTLKNK